MDIAEKLYVFLFAINGRDPSDVVVFLLATLLIAVVIVLADKGFHAVYRRSFLGLVHAPRAIWLFLLVWGFCAGVAGYLGFAIEFLQLNLKTSIIVGIAWPVILPRIVAGIRKSAGEPEVEEQPADEDEEVEE